MPRLGHPSGERGGCDGFGGGEISCDTTDKEIAATAVEGVFRRDAGIGATQDAGVRILAASQRFPLMGEIVPARAAVDITGIAFQQPRQ